MRIRRQKSALHSGKRGSIGTFALAAACSLWGCADPASISVEISPGSLTPGSISVAVRRGGPEDPEIINCTFDEGGTASDACPFEGGTPWRGGPLSFVLYGAPQTTLWLDVRAFSQDVEARMFVPATLPDEAGGQQQLSLRLSAEATENARYTTEAEAGEKTQLLAVAPVSADLMSVLEEPVLLIGAVDDQLERFAFDRRNAGRELTKIGATVPLGCTPRAGSMATLRRDVQQAQAHLLFVAGACDAAGSETLWVVNGPETGQLVARQFNYAKVSNPVFIPSEDEVWFVVETEGGDRRIEALSLLGSSTPPVEIGPLPAGGMGDFEPRVSAFYRNRTPFLVIAGAAGLTGMFGEIDAALGLTCQAPVTGRAERFCVLREGTGAALAPPLILEGLGTAARVDLIEREGGALRASLLSMPIGTSNVRFMAGATTELTLSDRATLFIAGDAEGLDRPQVMISDGAALERFTISMTDSLTLSSLAQEDVTGLLMANLDGQGGEELLSAGANGRLSLQNPTGALNNWWARGQGETSAVLVGGGLLGTVPPILQLTTGIFALRGGQITAIELGSGSYEETQFSWPMARRDPWGLRSYKSARNPMRTFTGLP